MAAPTQLIGLDQAPQILAQVQKGEIIGSEANRPVLLINDTVSFQTWYPVLSQAVFNNGTVVIEQSLAKVNGDQKEYAREFAFFCHLITHGRELTTNVVVISCATDHAASAAGGNKLPKGIASPRKFAPPVRKHRLPVLGECSSVFTVDQGFVGFPIILDQVSPPVLASFISQLPNLATFRGILLDNPAPSHLAINNLLVVTNLLRQHPPYRELVDLLGVAGTTPNSSSLLRALLAEPLPPFITKLVPVGMGTTFTLPAQAPVQNNVTVMDLIIDHPLMLVRALQTFPRVRELFVTPELEELRKKGSETAQSIALSTELKKRPQIRMTVVDELTSV